MPLTCCTVCNLHNDRFVRLSCPHLSSVDAASRSFPHPRKALMPRTHGDLRSSLRPPVGCDFAAPDRERVDRCAENAEQLIASAVAHLSPRPLWPAPPLGAESLTPAIVTCSLGTTVAAANNNTDSQQSRARLYQTLSVLAATSTAIASHRDHAHRHSRSRSAEPSSWRPVKRSGCGARSMAPRPHRFSSISVTLFWSKMSDQPCLQRCKPS